MAAADLDGLNAFLRAELARLEASRPGAARPGLRAGWEAARTSASAAIAERTGLPGEFVRGLLDRRELARRSAHTDCLEAMRELADSGFVSSVMAAAALAARTARGKG